MRAPLRYGAMDEKAILPQEMRADKLIVRNLPRPVTQLWFFQLTYLMTWTGSKLLSALTVTTIGLTSKAFLNSGLCSIQVNGLQTLKDALKSRNRNSGQGIITGSCYFQLP